MFKCRIKKQIQVKKYIFILILIKELMPSHANKHFFTTVNLLFSLSQF